MCPTLVTSRLCLVSLPLFLLWNPHRRLLRVEPPPPWLVFPHLGKDATVHVYEHHWSASRWEYMSMLTFAAVPIPIIPNPSTSPSKGLGHDDYELSDLLTHVLTIL